MKYTLTAHLLSVIFLSCNVFLLNQSQSIAQTVGAKSFICGMKNGLPTTMALRLDNRPKPLIRWVSSLGGLNPKQRCEIVSNRFEDLMNKKGMKFFTPGIYQGNYVVCAVANIGDSCTDNLKLFTVTSETEAKQVVDALRKLGSYVRGPIEQSDPIYTYFALLDYVASDKNEEFETPLLDNI